MRQESNQCVSDFITNLTLAIQDCGYKELKADNFEHAMLVQQLIVGLHNEKARENLLSEKKDLSWEKACDIASHQERVRQNLQQLNQSNDGVIASLESEMAVSLVNTAVSSPRERPSAPSKQLPSCYRCGQHHIRWSDCRHQKTVCQFCKKIGHIERVCFSKRRANSNTHATYPNPAGDGEAILRMFSANALLQPPYTITLPVDHHPVKFEIDTGSAVTLINEASLQKLPSLLPASSTFRSYTGQNVEVRGVFTAEVEHDGELHYLPVHVVRGSQQPNLLGRNWIKCVPSVLSYVHRIGANPALDSILVNHKDLFRDDSATQYRGPPVKFQFQSDFRPWTSRDPLLSRVKRALQSGWPSSTSSDFQPFFSRQNELSLQDGCILWGNRVVVPPQGRRAILRDLHNAHPGTVRMKALARSYVWWPKIDADIENVVKACHVCQITQKALPKVPLKPWAWPDSPWKRVHVDYFGPFQGHMVLVVVDAHTKWIDAIPTGNSCSSLTTINKLRTVFSTFGIPEMVVSDNGPAFTSAEFKDFMEKNGIRHLTTAPYHAASNGLAERAVQTIKHGLAKQTEADLATKLSRFLFSYRITPNDSTGASPAELMFKRQLRTRLDLLNPSTHDRVIAKQTKMKARYDANTRPRVIAPNESVYTRLEHETNWCPAVVRTSEGQIVELELEDGRIVRRHLDQVRSRTDTVSGEFGKSELPATLDGDPDIPRTEHLLPAQSITTPAEAYVLPSPPFTPANTSLGAEDPVTAQSGTEVETTALRRSTRIRKPVQRFQDESY
ncbi:hypothetical protein SprV_1002887500 [Sparganum proliferum]